MLKVGLVKLLAMLLEFSRASVVYGRQIFEIDNNGLENAIRPIALGRRNYLFSGNNSGAENNCIFYTLLGSCLKAGN